jgi:hypothetical protein
VTHDSDNARPCVRGDRCASRDANGQPALGPRALCDPDRLIVHRGLEQLPELYVELYLRLGARGSQAGGDSVRISGRGKHPPVPIRLDIDALMARIVEVLSSWDERVRHVARLSGPDTETGRHRRGGVALSTMCRTLAAHLDVLLALDAEPMNRTFDEGAVPDLDDDVEGQVRPAGWAVITVTLDGGDAALEILRLCAQARAKLGYTPQDQLLLSRCWDCDAPGKLVRHDGAAGLDDHVKCDNCGSEYVGPRLVRLMTDEETAAQKRATRKAAS